MTRDRALKTAIRAYMRAQGVNYTTARRAVIEHGYRPPAAGKVFADLAINALEKLVNDRLADHGVDIPVGVPALQDAWALEVVANKSSVWASPGEEYETAVMYDGEVSGQVRIAGWLPAGEAQRLKRTGVVTDVESAEDGFVTVAVTDRRWIIARVSALIDEAAEEAELQQVTFEWEDQS